MRTPLVHIGYPKTGSTWLQKSLLPRHPGLLLLRRATPGAAWIEEAAGHSSLPFDAKRLREQFDACAASAPERVPIVSYEAFVGDPFGAGLPAAELAAHVAELLPEARVALVVREPVALLESLYRQYVQIGGVLAPQVALGGSGNAAPVLSLEFLYFDRMREVWTREFGADRVHVLAYEQLLKDPRAFVSAFLGAAQASEFTGEFPEAGANRGTDGPALAALRVANRFAHSRFNANPLLPRGWLRQKWARRFLQRVVSPALSRFHGARNVLSAETRAELREHYRPHNAALAEATGLDLGVYGYSL